MSKQINKKYFTFPLCLLQKVHEDYNTGFDLIISFCIAHFSDKHEEKITKTAEWLNCRIGNKDNIIQLHQSANVFYEDQKQKFGEYPWPGVHTSFLFETRDKKNQSEIELFSALISIKSLLGKGEWTATNKKTILCRMTGCKTEKELNELLESTKNENIKKLNDKYSKRYHMDNIIYQLVKRGFIMSIFGTGRKIYLSHKLDYTMLVQKIKEANNNNIKENQRKARQILKSGLKKPNINPPEINTELQQNYSIITAELQQNHSRITAELQQ